MTSILVVEDQPLLLMNISEELSDRGFTILEASSADEALRRLGDNPLIRLMFTDVDMPGSMNGLGLADLVRGKYPDVGIIVTSGHGTLHATALPTGSRGGDPRVVPCQDSNRCVSQVTPAHDMPNCILVEIRSRNADNAAYALRFVEQVGATTR